jgi:hypothetical protein
MRRIRPRLVATALGLAIGVSILFSLPASTLASTRQLAMIQDDTQVLNDPVATLNTFRLLGAEIVRLGIAWSRIAPNGQSTSRPSFNAADPGAYPAGSWDGYDAVVRQAAADHLALDFTVGGTAPRWTYGPGDIAAPNQTQYPWEPSPKDFGAFMRAIGLRYSGHYTPPGSSSPLPRVSFWSIWNEPNFGEDLAPQAIKGSTVSVAPGMYRSLVNAAWGSLQATGHGHDTIVIGELAARGLQGPATRHVPGGFPGNFGQTKPLQFIRTLYCVDSSYKELRGAAAAARACPTSARASASFRAQNPGLFNASGFGLHPYPLGLPPNKDRSNDPDYATFPNLPHAESVLDRVQRIYGSGKRFAIYNDEYGYITNPPNRSSFPSPATAAYYINWAEYLSWLSPRLASTMQFLLDDPNPTLNTPEFGGFASGLIFYSGKPKPSFDAYRMPLYLPVTSTRHGHSVEVWGAARPAQYATHASAVQIQFRRGSSGAFATVKTVRISDPRGYFDVRVNFNAGGAIRLAWSYPSATTVFSRVQTITVN